MVRAACERWLPSDQLLFQAAWKGRRRRPGVGRRRQRRPKDDIQPSFHAPDFRHPITSARRLDERWHKWRKVGLTLRSHRRRRTTASGKNGPSGVCHAENNWPLTVVYSFEATAISRCTSLIRRGGCPLLADGVRRYRLAPHEFASGHRSISLRRADRFVPGALERSYNGE
jgi:hypothetical protein